MSEKAIIYTIREDEMFGKGNYGQAYLARKPNEKEGEKKLYVIKIPLEDIGEEKQLAFNNDIKIINILSHIPNNTYTSVIYGFKKYDNLKSEKNKEEEYKEKEKEIKVVMLNSQNEIIKEIHNPFYIMDFFSKGILLDYAQSRRLTERLAKFIFKRIIISYKFLHDHGICHLDVKPDNIIFDKNFWPIIIDFGFSERSKDKEGNVILVKTGPITEPYSAPETWKNKEYNGEKADIFSLGAVLFNLLIPRFAFWSARSFDPNYELIMNNNYEKYLNTVNVKNISEDFKKLFFKMVTNRIDERPDLDTILNDDPWLNEVNNLSQNEENQIIEELNGIREDIKTDNEIDIEEKIEEEHLKTRSGNNDEDTTYFEKNIKSKKLPKDRLIINQFIKIKGHLSEVDFMNSLANAINKIFGDNSFVEASGVDLKFEVSFEYKEIDEKEIKKDDDLIKNCKMMIELFEIEQDNYLLEFRRTGGRTFDYYHHFAKIKDILKNKLY